MQTLQAFFNSPIHMLFAIVVGDVTIAYFVLKYGSRFVLKLYRDVKAAA